MSHKKPNQVEVTAKADEAGVALARLTLDPLTRHASLALSYGSQIFSDDNKPTVADASIALVAETQQVLSGNLALASRLHAAQAISLDTIFTELTRRAGENLGHYPIAAERYMRLALKAQVACRATLEAMAKLHQPREQIVKHIHVGDGGQALIADQYHHHAGGPKIGNEKQSDAIPHVSPTGPLHGSDQSGE